MKLGFTTMNTPIGPTPSELGVALQERGFDSLWIGEHSHIPAARTTPYPGGGEMPELYRSMMNPFLSLLAAALAAPSLTVGTGVALPLEHDLFDLAKTIATLDVLTGGRVKVGVGVGWNQEELANTSSVPWSQRYRALGEAVAALRAMWTENESEFHGEFFDFDPVWSFPKPVQTPHPAVYMGAGGKLGTREALAWADGWMPMDVALGNVAKKVARFRESAEAAGRDPDMPITIVAFGHPTRDTLATYRDLGVERTVLGASRRNEEDPTSALAFLDEYAPLTSELA